MVPIKLYQRRYWKVTSKILFNWVQNLKAIKRKKYNKIFVWPIFIFRYNKYWFSQWHIPVLAINHLKLALLGKRRHRYANHPKVFHFPAHRAAPACVWWRVFAVKLCNWHSPHLTQERKRVHARKPGVMSRLRLMKERLSEKAARESCLERERVAQRRQNFRSLNAQLYAITHVVLWEGAPRSTAVKNIFSVAHALMQPNGAETMPSYKLQTMMPLLQTLCLHSDYTDSGIRTLNESVFAWINYKNCLNCLQIFIAHLYF